LSISKLNQTTLQPHYNAYVGSQVKDRYKKMSIITKCTSSI